MGTCPKRLSIILHGNDLRGDHENVSRHYRFNLQMGVESMLLLEVKRPLPLAKKGVLRTEALNVTKPIRVLPHISIQYSVYQFFQLIVLT
jgi:hypothetical protein